MMSVEIQTFVERRLGVSQKAIIEFCQRWQMIEFKILDFAVSPPAIQIAG